MKVCVQLEAEIDDLPIYEGGDSLSVQNITSLFYNALVCHSLENKIDAVAKKNLEGIKIHEQKEKFGRRLIETIKITFVS